MDFHDANPHKVNSRGGDHSCVFIFPTRFFCHIFPVRPCGAISFHLPTNCKKKPRGWRSDTSSAPVSKPSGVKIQLPLSLKCHMLSNHGESLIFTMLHYNKLLLVRTSRTGPEEVFTAGCCFFDQANTPESLVRQKVLRIEEPGEVVSAFPLLHDRKRPIAASHPRCSWIGATQTGGTIKRPFLPQHISFYFFSALHRNRIKRRGCFLFTLRYSLARCLSGFNTARNCWILFVFNVQSKRESCGRLSRRTRMTTKSRIPQTSIDPELID